MVLLVVCQYCSWKGKEGKSSASEVPVENSFIAAPHYSKRNDCSSWQFPTSSTDAKSTCYGYESSNKCLVGSEFHFWGCHNRLFPQIQRCPVYRIDSEQV